MTSQARKPNIVVFFTDDQRFDTIQALGNKEIVTPNLDRLVNMGTTYTHGHIPCGTSGAVCMPSRAMLHTGRSLFHLAGEGQRIPADHITLGETLQKAGYRTFGTGKWHNGPEGYARSFTDGAEIFFGGMWDHWNVPACNYDPTGRYEAAIPWIRNPFQDNKVQKLRADHIRLGVHSTELFSEASIDFIEGYDDASPFFMYLAFMAPHDPRSMPEKFRSMYDPDKLSLPENFAPEHAFDFGGRDIRDEVLAPYPRTPEIVREHLAEYYGMISHLDHEVGRVIAALEQKGEFENTIFVFAGDNGLAVGQHGLFGKQNCYEHSIRVPLIFAGPGIPSGERRDTYAYLFDIYPTLCDLLGIDVPASVDGKSLRPSIDNAGVSHRDDLFFAYTNRVRSVKDARYKLIEYVYDNAITTQLFDLTEDPLEMENLAGRPECQQKVAALRDRLSEYSEAWDEREHRLGKSFWDQYEAAR